MAVRSESESTGAQGQNEASKMQMHRRSFSCFSPFKEQQIKRVVRKEREDFLKQMARTKKLLQEEVDGQEARNLDKMPRGFYRNIHE